MLTNSFAVSRSVCMMEQSEPVPQPVAEWPGAYVGKTLQYKLPFFLDTSKLMNPHVSLIGMTGSGKTYFMKSYLIRCRLGRDASILIIDWNNEYNEIVTMLDGTIHRLCSTAETASLDFNLLCNGVHSINLASMHNDIDRRDAATAIIHSVTEFMHGMKIGNSGNRIIVLDEAWKLLNDKAALTQLFREGRKYGIGVMVATQLVKDINNEILSNTACVAVFRIQNSDDSNALLETGIVDNEGIDSLTTLPVGRCLLHLVPKTTSQKTKFAIARIEGIQTTVYTIKSDRMQMKVSGEKFIWATESLIKEHDKRAKIVNMIEANERELDSVGFIRFLLRLGLDRSIIVPYLRLLGLTDRAIADSFNSAKGAMVEIE